MDNLGGSKSRLKKILMRLCLMNSIEYWYLSIRMHKN